MFKNIFKKEKKYVAIYLGKITTDVINNSTQIIQIDKYYNKNINSDFVIIIDKKRNTNINKEQNEYNDIVNKITKKIILNFNTLNIVFINTIEYTDNNKSINNSAITNLNNIFNYVRKEIETSPSMPIQHVNYHYVENVKDNYYYMTFYDYLIKYKKLLSTQIKFNITKKDVSKMIEIFTDTNVSIREEINTIIELKSNSSSNIL